MLALYSLALDGIDPAARWAIIAAMGAMIAVVSVRVLLFDRKMGLCERPHTVTGSDLRQRLTAILAADASGYSRLMAADEGGTVAALDAAREVFRKQIDERQGRVIDMAGDSVLSVFETAVGAVNAALAIQEALESANSTVPAERLMCFRIGVHLGDVIEKPDGTVYGDGVNIAARLQSLAEPGGLVVSDAVQGAVRGKVAATFSDQGEQAIKNIPHPVRIYRVSAKRAASPDSRRLAGQANPPLPDRPSIAVLPFVNMSGDPEQEYFIDGVVEDILTTLSKIRDLLVIARNSSFTYKGRSVDVRTVGRELSVKYVLEGSVRKAGNRVRVAAQLVDCADGRHLWAEHYDGELDDIFTLQDRITHEIVTALQISLTDGEQARIWRMRSGSPLIFEKFSVARELYSQFTKRTHLQTRRLLEEALTINPTFGSALELLGYTLVDLGRFGWEPDQDECFKAALQCAARALEADRSFGQAYSVIGYVRIFQHRFDEAVDAAEKAVFLSPNSSIAFHMSAMVHTYAGNFRVGGDYEEQATRLSPIDREVSQIDLARARFHLNMFEAARGIAVQVLESRPRWLTAQTILLASLWRLGREPEARTLGKMILESLPSFSVARWSRGFPYRKTEDLEALMGPLREAGLPE